MAKISLAMITFNEQHNITSVLNNVYDMFDEIIIVDGYSIDKTTRKIEEFRLSNNDSKIKLYINKQEGSRYSRGWNQSVQRNLALKKCTKDWIFCLDADERLDANIRVKLDNLISTSHKAFAMPTYHYWDEEGQIRADWYPDYHYRFWKNNIKIVYSRQRRHCGPIIPSYSDVRRLKGIKEELPCTDIIIHHYHHVPIKKSGSVYRAYFRDVRSMKALMRGMKITKVESRIKSRRETDE